MNASRAVWVLAHGDPGTSFVLHTCHRGVEGCINLRHLYLGDQARNIRDMYAVGRNGTPDRTGEANPRRKLTEREVEEIRQRYRAGGVRQVDLAEEYGVSQNNVSCIVRGENWVPEGATRRTAAMRRKRPSTETVEAVRARWAQGDVSQAAVAAEFGIGQTTVSRIVRGVR
ncbi:hypothetical protein OV450_1343 [Actinobacteria bacterium OV450]|nr:hypothetical protein OV450_1343 [Actinobacteria bacterium OV450]